MASRKRGMARVARLRYWQAEDARVVVEAWRESGEELTAFARRHGIKPRRLRQWAERLEGSEEAMAFHPVRVVQAKEAAGEGPVRIPPEVVHRIQGMLSSDSDQALLSIRQMPSTWAVEA